MLWMLVAVQMVPAQVAPAVDAQPDPCPAIAQLIVAARERPAFASVQAALARGEAVVPGYEAADCAVGAEGLSCRHWSMSPRRFGRSDAPLACPGLTVVEVGQPARPPFRNSWTQTYSTQGLRLTFGARCLSCAGPGSSFFRLGPQVVPPPDR